MTSPGPATSRREWRQRGSELRRRAWGHDVCERVLRRGRREEGQALVEMAIALPVLLLLLIGIIQFGLLLNKYITLTDAARAGARQLAIEAGSSDPCDPAVAQALISGSAIGLQSSQVTPSFTAMSTTSTTTTTTTGTTTTTTTPDECSTGTYTYNSSYTSTTNTNTTGNENAGDEATITAKQPFTLSVFGLGVLNLTLSASASDQIE